MGKVLETARTFVPVISECHTLIAELDVLLNFAHVSTSAPEPYVRPTLVKPEDAQQRIVLKVSHPGLSQAPTPAHTPTQSLQPQPQPRPRPNPNRAAAIRASNA